MSETSPHGPDCIAHIWIEFAIPDGPVCIDEVHRPNETLDVFDVHLRSPVWLKKKRTVAERTLSVGARGSFVPFVREEEGWVFNEQEARELEHLWVSHRDSPSELYVGLLVGPDAIDRLPNSMGD